LHRSTLDFLDKGLIYFELDCASNIQSKAASIRSSPLLRDFVPPPSDAGPVINSSWASLHSTNDRIHPIDLRDLPNQPKDILSSIDTTLSILIISECSLCYLSPDDASAVLNHFASTPFLSTTPRLCPLRANVSVRRLLSHHCFQPRGTPHRPPEAADIPLTRYIKRGAVDKWI
jgi:hypothetical protein